MSGTCQMLPPEWVFHPKETNPSKKEPKRNVKQRESIQPVLEKFINVCTDDPQHSK